MEDLSHWDYANSFTAVEVAALIVGKSLDPYVSLVAKRSPVFKRLEADYQKAWAYWHSRVDGCFEFNESAILPDDAFRCEEMIEFQNKIDTVSITENMAECVDTFIGHGTHNDSEFSAFQNQTFSRAEIVRWLTAIGMKSVYQFDLRTHVAAPTLVQTDPDIDPADLPIELDAANMAYRAILNGYGNQSDTFRNRLIGYLQTNYTDLKPEAVQRIATVANPDKAAGRKKLNKE